MKTTGRSVNYYTDRILTLLSFTHRKNLELFGGEAWIFVVVMSDTSVKTHVLATTNNKSEVVLGVATTKSEVVLEMTKSAVVPATTKCEVVLETTKSAVLARRLESEVVLARQLKCVRGDLYLKSSCL